MSTDSADDYRAEFHAKQRERRRAEIEAMIPPRHRGVDLAVKVHHWARHLADREPAGNLIILGPTGTGKTTQAWQAVRYVLLEFVDRYEFSQPGGSMPTPSIVWHRAGDLAAKLRPSDGPDGGVEDTIRVSRNAQILVVDDLGSTPFTPWQLGQLERIIDHRWQHELPILATSNRPDLADMLGQRLASRLWQDATVITMTGTDHRKP